MSYNILKLCISSRTNRLYIPEQQLEESPTLIGPTFEIFKMARHKKVPARSPSPGKPLSTSTPSTVSRKGKGKQPQRVMKTKKGPRPKKKGSFKSDCRALKKHLDVERLSTPDMLSCATNAHQKVLISRSEVTPPLHVAAATKCILTDVLGRDKVRICADVIPALNEYLRTFEVTSVIHIRQ